MIFLVVRWITTLSGLKVDHGSDGNGFTNSTRPTGTATVKGTPYRDCVRDNAAPLDGHPEFSTHPPGVALLLAPILFPFRGTQLIEPLAICCSAIAMIIAMLMFRSLIRKYNSNSAFADLVTVVTFLGTPAWLYGRTLFNEPYLLLFAIGSYSLALRGKNPVLAGILIGCGMLMKPPFALLIIPLFLMYCPRAPIYVGSAPCPACRCIPDCCLVA